MDRTISVVCSAMGAPGKKQHHEQDPDYPETLARAAMLVPDREQLFRLIERTPPGMAGRGHEVDTVTERTELTEKRQEEIVLNRTSFIASGRTRF